jgi:hypothetical protein
MNIDLTAEHINKTIEIALVELFNSDSWTSGRKEADVTKIAETAQYLLNIIESQNKSK